MRIKVTTTLRRDLYEALQIESMKRRCNATSGPNIPWPNDILEELIAEHLKRSKQKGGD